MEQSREEILASIHQMELKYELMTWQIQDLHVWPLVRIFIFNELTQKKVTGIRNNEGKSSLFKEAISGLLELFKLTLKSRTGIKGLIFSSQIYRQEIEGLFYNRFADPILDSQSLDDNSQFLFETAKQNEYTRSNYKGNRLVKLSPILDLLQLLTILKQKFSKSNLHIKQNIEQIVELPEQVRKKLIKKLNRQFQLIPYYQRFSHLLLKQYQGEQVFFVCYYGLLNMVMISEAKKLNIPTVDIQHGVISDKHIAYAFQQLPADGYNSLPNEFWTWSTYEASCINHWAQSFSEYEAKNMGNPWIEAVKENKIDFGNLADQIKQEEKPIILYTLSNRADIFPEYLVEAIKALSGKYAFWLRLHPRQLAFKSKIEEQLKALELFNCVELERATYLPLPLILRHTKLHITQFSTVVLEAAYFEVPSLLFHPLGKTYFEDNPLKKYVYFYDHKKGEMANLLETLLTF